MKNEKWTFGRGAHDPVLYNLPALVAAKYAIVTEGESKVDLLKSWGLIATCLDSGAQSPWHDSYMPYFEGKEKIVILPDCDAPGQAYAERIATAISGKVPSLKIVNLPGLDPKGDIIDWAKIEGNDKAALLEIIKQAPEWKLASQEKEVEIYPEFPEVVKGLAGRFALLYSQHIESPPAFTYMAFLTCLGNLISGRIRLASELPVHPRLYTLIIGESADDRKSTAVDQTTEFFKEAFLDFTICHGVGSAEGLQKKLQTIPDEPKKLLIFFDEFKQFVSKCRIEASVLLPCVNTLFESTRYENHTKKEAVKLEGVHLSIVGCTTKNTYDGMWSSAFVDIGFNNRLFLVPGTGKRRFAIPKEIPLGEKMEIKKALAGILANLPEKLEITPPAMKLFEAWYHDENREASIHSKRLDTYAMRLMILLAINMGRNEVDEEVVRDAIKLVDWQLKVRKILDPVDADNQIAKMEARIRRVLDNKGTLSRRSLGQSVGAHRAGLWTFQTALRNLMEAGEITCDGKGYANA